LTSTARDGGDWRGSMSPSPAVEVQVIGEGATAIAFLCTFIPFYGQMAVVTWRVKHLR